MSCRSPYEQSISLMASNLLCLMVVTYYSVPVFVAILVYVGIYYIAKKAITKWPITTCVTNTTSVIPGLNACSPWQGTVGWALGRVSAHKRSVCRVSEANRTRPQTSVQQTLHQISYSFRCKQHANCRGEITPTAVVYNVHTLYIHVWILPLSAKLVHSELLLTQVSNG